MKRPDFLLLAQWAGGLGLALFLGCYGFEVEGELIAGDPDARLSIREVSIDIQLPPEAPLTADELSVSSLLTEANPVTAGRSYAEVYAGDHLEVVYAADTDGRIVLIGLVDGESDELTLSIESSAQAMVLLHPWAFDLSPAAKREALNYMTGLPEYAKLHTAITAVINQGAINPLLSQSVQDELFALSKAVVKTLEADIEPLRFRVEDGQATVTNMFSSVAYGVGLYDADQEWIEGDLCGAVAKEYLSLYDFYDRNFPPFEDQLPRVGFDLPEKEGQYWIRARNGLAFDGSPEDARGAAANATQLFGQSLGLLSTAGEAFLRARSEEECIRALGSVIAEDMQGPLKSFAAGTLTGPEVALALFGRLAIGSINVSGLLAACVPEEQQDFLRMLPGPTVRLFEFMTALNRSGALLNVYDGVALFTEWYNYQPAIDFCFFSYENGTATECYNYPTITVNGKVWLARNLWVEVSGSSCYDDWPGFCTEYGRLYTREAAIEGCRSLGPGWRLPTYAEWQNLSLLFGGYQNCDGEEVGSSDAALRRLLVGGSSSFDAQLGGFYLADSLGSSYLEKDMTGVYWSSDYASGVQLLWGFYSHIQDGELTEISVCGSVDDVNQYRFSCRCIRG